MMRIATGLSREPLGVRARPAEVVDAARAAEAAGFPSAWTVHFSRGLDALTVLGHAASATTSLHLGVGVVPTYPRHPIALAQQAATVQALAGGRLTLGVGVSHRSVIEGMHGLTYTSPAAHTAEYLQVLVPLLREEGVRLQGRCFEVEAEIGGQRLRALRDPAELPATVRGGRRRRAGRDRRGRRRNSRRGPRASGGRRRYRTVAGGVPGRRRTGRGRADPGTAVRAGERVNRPPRPRTAAPTGPEVPR